ncbi:ribonuclease E inhibitor RraB [Cohnella suwonensis]|uniref:Ribonuclease E inhibitor RraB n=1 Tax=Cohnella suwonensis TaxID=696072 RepID=A0ABW0M2F0_9BACL
MYSFVEENTHQEESVLPYQLVLSNMSAVELQTINRFTTELLKKAAAVGGNYDGWESPVIK